MVTRSALEPRTLSDGDGAPSTLPGFDAGDCLVGRYRLIRFIAAGGMGEVFEADDLLLGARVAIKTIRPDLAGDRRALARFRREVLLARKVTHRNVCRIFELAHARVGEVEVPFLVMELLDGETLAARIARTGGLSPTEALAIAAGLAVALDAAHAAGVLHRDFKSSNVVLTDRPVVTDFGLARAQDTLEGDGGTSGTPDYMAPEQMAGGTTTPRTDVYAFGVVLFEMVTGGLPFVGVDRRAGLAAPSARSRVPDLDPRWDAAIARCLAVEPAQRFARAGEVLIALGAGSRGRPRGRWFAAATLGASLVATLLWSTGAGTGGSAPPELERGLAAFNAAIDDNRLADARATIERLREQPAIDPGELRLDIAEAQLADAIGDYRTMQAAAARAAVKARGRGDREMLAVARDTEQWALYNLGEPERVREAVEELRQLRRELGDEDGAVRTLRHLGTLAMERGELAAARRHYDAVLAHFRPKGLEHIGMTLAFTVDLELRRGRLVEVDRLLAELEPLRATATFRPAVAFNDMMVARRRELGGDRVGARALYAAAEQVYREFGDNRNLAGALVGLGRVLAAEGDLAGARGRLAEANTIRQTLGVQRTIAESQTALAELALAEHDPVAAEPLARAAATEMARQGALDAQALADIVLARAMGALGRGDERRRLLAPHLARGSESAEVRTRLAIAAGDAAALDAAIAETKALGLLGLEHEARAARATARPRPDGAR